MKEILVLCGCYPKEFENEYIENSIGLAQVAADRLQKNIINGICEIPNVTPYVLTAPFVGYFPKTYKKLFIKSHKEYEKDNIKFKIVGFLNIKGIETWIKSERLFHQIVRWCKASPENRNVIMYSHYAGFMRAIGKAKKRFPDLNVSCVITDMPEISEQTPSSLIGKIKTIPRNTMFRTTYKNLPKINYFALLSKHMAEHLALTQDRFCVVECMCEPNLPDAPKDNEFLKNKDDSTVCLAYTGTLNRRYGIKELLNAFQSVDNDKLRLWICGDGDAKDDVLNSCSQDSRIIYFGCLKHSDVLNLQNAADILINPRSPEGIYTKYSFPSKTIEYMIAGKPVIAYKLMGIPDEYDEYLNYIEDDNGGLSNSIKIYGNKEKKELEKIGRKNREFAKKNKNYIVQTKKILSLMGVDDI